MQLAMSFPIPKPDRVLTSLSDLPSDWNQFPRISIDTETKDPTLTTMGIGVRRGAYRVGVSLAFEDGPRFYLPTKHAGGDNFDHDQVNAYLRDNARTYKNILVGANLQYDLDYLEEEKITFPEVKSFRDVLVVDAIINELQRSYSLESVAQRRVGVGKDEALLFEAAKKYGARTMSDVKKILWSLPGKLVEPYAIQDAFICLPTLRAQEKIIDEEELWDTFHLEAAVLPVCLRMRRRGIKINEDKLDLVNTWAISQEQEALAEVHRLTGVSIGIGNTMKVDVVSKAFEAIGIAIPKTAKGNISIDKEWLATVDHPVGKLVRRGRQMFKLRNTYVDSVRAHLVNGRAHCTFNQLRKSKDEDDSNSGTEGAITGRLSSSDYNIQFQPGDANPEIGVMWRDIYEPEDGCVWGSPDYSQQEPRWLVQWSVWAGPRRIGEAAHASALEFCKRYQDDPSTDFHNMTAGFAGIKRKPAKIVGLAITYGRGGASLCHQLDLPTRWVEKTWGGEKRTVEEAGEEGQEITDKFNRAVPFAQAMLKADIQQAKNDHYIRTYIKRRLHFEINQWGKIEEPHAALNKRIQGTSADQTKKAMVELDKAGYYIQVQAHDEIGGSFGSHAEAKAAAEIMENCVRVDVPFKVDVATGTSWGECLKA